MLKTMFCQYSWTHFFLTELFFICRTTRKLAFSEVVSLIQCNAAQYDKFFQIFSTYNQLQLEITLILFWRPLLLVISFCIRTVCTCILQCLQELTKSCYQIVSPEFISCTYKIIAFFAEPGLGVALALPDIDELCELPPKSTLLGPYWTWDGVNE